MLGTTVCQDFLFAKSRLLNSNLFCLLLASGKISEICGFQDGKMGLGNL